MQVNMNATVAHTIAFLGCRICVNGGARNDVTAADVACRHLFHLLGKAKRSGCCDDQPGGERERSSVLNWAGWYITELDRNSARKRKVTRGLC